VIPAGRSDLFRHGSIPVNIAEIPRDIGVILNWDNLDFIACCRTAKSHDDEKRHQGDWHNPFHLLNPFIRIFSTSFLVG
jgi:hypothetical protein